jgi:hypothetical protein
MNRLQRELHRLYIPPAASGEAPDAATPRLIDADGRVRAMVLTLAGPADWPTLAPVWKGVQVDLELPAPGIAVSGSGGHQLWFSLAEPVPVAQAQAFLEAVCRRYLADIQPARLTRMPSAGADSARPALHADPVPAEQPKTGHWSAFVAPDLAPVFADEPWLELPPNPEGQAQLLARLQSIRPADFQQALERLRPEPASTPVQPAIDSVAIPAEAAGAKDTQLAAAGPWLDPRGFLLAVINDDSIALSLRIDAAKALLPAFDAAARP